MSPSIVISGAPGLVGQNLIPRLKTRGYTKLLQLTNIPRTRPLCGDCTRRSKSSRRTWRVRMAGRALLRRPM